MGSTGIVEGQILSCRLIFPRGRMRWTRRISCWCVTCARVLGNTANSQVVGTADRKIHVVDLNTPGSIYRVGRDLLYHDIQGLTFRQSIRH